MITKINPSGVNKFPEQVFKNLAKAKNHYEKHKKIIGSWDSQL